ncbi:unnamed protein product [Allacma fusca]|uniref:Uncharacterized protein n=1 Tax=Allacma fusca TaxID=39272 RepID=A0A8J2JW18_9HEXA|nr:unnamed protein product [Allacma fusca]
MKNCHLSYTKSLKITIHLGMPLASVTAIKPDENGSLRKKPCFNLIVSQGLFKADPPKFPNSVETIWRTMLIRAWCCKEGFRFSPFLMTRSFCKTSLDSENRADGRNLLEGKTHEFINRDGDEENKTFCGNGRSNIFFGRIVAMGLHLFLSEDPRIGTLKTKSILTIGFHF